MVVNNPLKIPYIYLRWVALGGGTLGFPWIFDVAPAGGSRTFAQPREFVVAWHIRRPVTRPSRNPGGQKRRAVSVRCGVGFSWTWNQKQKGDGCSKHHQNVISCTFPRRLRKKKAQNKKKWTPSEGSGVICARTSKTSRVICAGVMISHG